jgi:hypothetical protein
MKKSSLITRHHFAFALICAFSNIPQSFAGESHANLKAFEGEWVSVSQACAPGSKLNELKYQEDPEPKHFTIKTSEAGSVWLTIAGTLECKQNCESPFVHLERENANDYSQIRVSSSDTFATDGSEKGKASCTYEAIKAKARKARPKK